MNKIASVTAKFQVFRDFTESIIEMINDGELETEEEIREYIYKCMYEDVQEMAQGVYFTSQSSMVDIDIKFENKEDFKVGDFVDVIPSLEDGDDFSEFSGRVDSFRDGYITVIDQEDNAFDVYPWQVTISA